MEAHIIVIDDNEAVQKMLSESLKSDGYGVSSYNYDSISLSNLRVEQPDLIILGFKLEDGGKEWQFLQMLKMEETTANIPILISVTALQLSAEIQNYLLTQYISVIRKPFDLNQLLILVKQTLLNASRAGVIFTSDRKLPILVVDDTEDLLATTTEVLMLEGYQVVSATNGMVALDAVSRAEHCLILLDLVMPIMDGYGFLQAYNRQLRPHSPVIILSGETKIQREIFPSFVVGVLAKPFNISHLINLVEKYARL